MKTKKVLIFSILVILITSCVRENHKSHYCKYDIKIQYAQNKDTVSNNLKRPKLAKDSLHLFFESRFDNDRVTLYVNKKVVFDDTITTNYSVGLAKYLELGKLSKIHSLGIRVNNGNLAFAELGRKHLNNIVKVDFFKKELIIILTRKEHEYY